MDAELSDELITLRAHLEEINGAHFQKVKELEDKVQSSNHDAITAMKKLAQMRSDNSVLADKLSEAEQKVLTLNKNNCSKKAIPNPADEDFSGRLKIYEDEITILKEKVE